MCAIRRYTICVLRTVPLRDAYIIKQKPKPKDGRFTPILYTHTLVKNMIPGLDTRQAYAAITVALNCINVMLAVKILGINPNKDNTDR